MAKDDRSNEFFKHLEQSSPPPQPRKLRSAGTENHLPASAASRPVPEKRGPGLSPGMPVIERPVTGENSALRPRSGVVLTPSGVKRVDEDTPAPVQEPEPEPVQEDVSEGAESRAKNDGADVVWEEYAATDFPALPAEDLGVKTKMTDSGRVVPVAVRADLTEEALKGKSVKGKHGAGRAPKPVKSAAKATTPPRSWMGKIGHSLRARLLGAKPAEEDDQEIDEWTEQQLEDETKGFARSGSKKGSKSTRKSTPLTILRNFVIEVCKLILLVLLLRAYVLQVSEVNGPSMDSTLSGGDSSKSQGADRLVVERVTAHLANVDEKWTGWLPDFMHPRFQRGDIVVVRSPENPGSELVKRLIALPGDVLKFEDEKLFLKYGGQGEFHEVDESYLDPGLVSSDGKKRKSYESGSLDSIFDNGKEITVPDKRIFVMGDNRRHSNDSRRWLEIEVGKSETAYGGADQKLAGHNRLWLHLSSIEGRVIFRIYPFDRVWPPVK